MVPKDDNNNNNANKTDLALLIVILVLIFILLIVTVMIWWQIRVKFREVPSLVKRAESALANTSETASSVWQSMILPRLKNYFASAVRKGRKG